MGKWPAALSAWPSQQGEAAPKLRIAAAIIVGVLGSTAMDEAQAQTKKYGSAAGWDIRGDMALGCLMAKRLSNSMQVQMGIDTTAGKRGYMALYTKADAKIASGAKRSVNNLDFIYDLAKKKTLTITPVRRDPFAPSLAGTDAAFKALRACQEAQ